MIRSIMFSLLFLLSCSTEKFELIEIQNSELTVREGIAVNPMSGEIFISNLNVNTVSRSDANGQLIEICLSDENTEYSVGLGLEVHKEYIYALSNNDGGTNSRLFITDMDTRISHSYAIMNRDTVLLNDLAINEEGDAYITDSKNSQIYKYDHATRTTSLFLTSDQFYYPNGIAINNDGSQLFISSSTYGIRIVDIETQEILNPIHETKDTGIDGMKYKNGYLYFVMRSRGEDKIIAGFYRVKIDAINNHLGAIESILIDEKVMPSPTTISVTENHVYILANSQLDMYNEVSNTITDNDNLQNTRVIKMSINNIEDLVKKNISQ